MTSVADPVGIAILFWTLRQHLYHIIVNELSSNNSRALGHSQGDLFQAKEEIYSIVAHVFKGAATAKLVSAWLPLIVDCTKLLGLVCIQKCKQLHYQVIGSFLVLLFQYEQNFIVT
jgi:hypothetical protein